MTNTDSFTTRLAKLLIKTDQQLCRDSAMAKSNYEKKEKEDERKQQLSDLQD
ncbi:MAG: hypothetical protein ABFQ62_05085 [Patescibacteria group bacterium]